MKKTKCITFASLLLLVVPIIQAWGVSNPYISENPIRIKAGESSNITLELQNMLDEDMTIKIKIENISSSSIIGFVTEESYDLPQKTRKDLVISISTKKITPSGNYTLVVHALATPKTNREGQVGVTGATKTKVNIEIINPVMDIVTSPVTITITILIIVGGIIGVVYHMRKKRHGRDKKDKKR